MEILKGTTVYFDDRLKKALRIVCISESLTMSAYVCKAVQEKLDKKKENDK